MDSCLFVLFGATGDLATRKLIPALYRGFFARDTDARLIVLGTARSDWDDEDMREAVRESLDEASISDDAAAEWCDGCTYYTPVGEDDDLTAVFDRAAELEEEHDLPGNRVYYLALPPAAFPSTIEAIGENLEERKPAPAKAGGTGWTRLVVEKPFGDSLERARELNALVHRYFREEQVYRIDHFLGKETVQNLLVFRFANALFESAWDRNHIDRVEITVAETLGVEGRAGYYDRAGHLRDMIQNHLTQLLTLAAMEPPARLDAEGIRREKIKVLRSMLPIDPGAAVFGRYTAGEVGGEEVPGYLDEEGVPDDSTTETFVALPVFVQNWRWQGVPFLLRTGKRMPERLTDIAVYFRSPPVQLFGGPDACSLTRNVLRIRLQPDEGFSLGFEVKAPGGMGDGAVRLSQQRLHFDYDEAFGELPGAYETLLRDVVQGDQTLFVHAEEAEEAWTLYQPLLDADIEPASYPAGTWGPKAAARLFVSDDRNATVTPDPAEATV